MKHQFFVLLAFMSVSGVVWSHGFRGNYGPNLYPNHSNPYAPNSPPYAINAPQHFHHGQLNINPHGLNSVPNFNSQHWHGPIPRSGSRLYTPYSTPNPYRFHGHRFNFSHHDNSPYSPGSIVNPYGIYRNIQPSSPFVSPYFLNWIER